MKNKNLKNMKNLLEKSKKFGKTQKHFYHMVTSSPWPFMGSLSALTLTMGAVMYMHNFMYGKLFLILGLSSVMSTMVFWWSDVILEATFGGYHTKCVVAGLSIGMILFIISEVMFFFSFFWAFFHASLVPSMVLGGIWPPMGLQILSPFHIPLLNTMILLTSGMTVTLSHYWLCTPKNAGFNLIKMSHDLMFVFMEDKFNFYLMQYSKNFEFSEIKNIWVFKNNLNEDNKWENLNEQYYWNNLGNIKNNVVMIMLNIKKFFNNLVMYFNFFISDLNYFLTILCPMYLYLFKNLMQERLNLFNELSKVYNEVKNDINILWNKDSDLIDDKFDEELAIKCLDEYNKKYKELDPTMIISENEIDKFFMDNSFEGNLSNYLSEHELKKIEQYEEDLVAMRFYLETFDYLKKMSPLDWWIVFAYMTLVKNYMKMWKSLCFLLMLTPFEFMCTYILWDMWLKIDAFILKSIPLLKDDFFFMMLWKKFKDWIYYCYLQFYKEDTLILKWLILELHNPHKLTMQKWALWLTIMLAIEFTMWQGFEYYDALFYITDGIYGSTFYVTTGFHGLHVFIGTIFLMMCCIRLQLHHFSFNHHFGYEAAIWYWHFVDVVWLFLFMFIYIWGSGI